MKPPVVAHVPAPLRERIWRIPPTRVPAWVKRLAKHPSQPAKGDPDAKPRSSSALSASVLPSIGTLSGAEAPSSGGGAADVSARRASAPASV